MKKVFVTGADGLLGSNLVRELLNRGYKVRAFMQKARKTNTLEGLSIEQFEGDLLNKESIVEGMQGCHYVIHAAASTSIWPTRNQLVRKINIEGTLHVAESALAHSVERMVYVGTANSYGFGSKETPGHEQKPYSADKYKLDYMDSKYEAHQLVLQFIEKGLNAIVVNPTFMIGPFDSGPSSGAMIVAICKKKIRGYTSGGRNYICVRDAAIGIANGLTMGRTGEGYILGNANLTYQEIFSKIATVAAVKPPGLSVPSWAVLMAGHLASLKSTVSKKPPMLSSNMAKIAVDKHYFSAKKAVEELQLPQTPIEVGIKEAFDWFKTNNYL